MRSARELDVAARTLLTPEQQVLREVARDYLERHVAPVVDVCERAGTFPRELLPGLSELGYTGGVLPEEAGGHGLSYTDLVVLMEQAGYQWTSLRATLSVINMVGAMLWRGGTDEQRELYLDRVVRGQAVCWFGLSEPEHGSDVRSLDVTATQHEDGFRIRGTKLWITNGAVGDFGIVLAAARTSAGEELGPTAFLIDPTRCAFQARRIETMFIKATTTSELVFDDTTVPLSAVVGEVGKGMELFSAGLHLGRLNVAAGAVGAGQRALDLATTYAQQRSQFGRQIGRFQLVQELIADIRLETTAARAMTLLAARALDTGVADSVETALAKLYATESAFRAADRAVQVHGGMGLSVEMGVERLFRDTRGGTIVEGTSQIQRLLIARDQLGLSAFT